MNKKFAKLQSNSKYKIKSFKCNIQKCRCLIDFKLSIENQDPVQLSSVLKSHAQN